MSKQCPRCGAELADHQAGSERCPRCLLELGLESLEGPSEATTLGRGERRAYPSLDPGLRLGRFEILAPLGRGGMGEVYRAHDHRLGREVALKVLARTFLDDTEGRRRLQREARAVSRLTHPHICTLYDLESADGHDFLVMELLEGETLGDRLCRGPLPVDEVQQYAREILAALGRAHQLGLVHRDLKPGNVMLTATGSKLLDFGVAKALPESGFAKRNDSATRPGMVVGTLQFMAPEQLEGRPVDSRTDLFAFGALVYEMLTGEPAFAGDSEASLIGSILHVEPKALTQDGGGLPPGWRSLLRRCLEKRPDDRPASAQEVLEALDRIETGEVEPAEPRTPSSPLVLAVPRFQAPDAERGDQALADGLAEEIFTRLSRWGRFPVIAHHPSLATVGSSLDLQRLGEELGFQYAVVGSVRRSEKRVRTHVRVVEAETGNQVWAEHFDRQQGEMQDVFELQDDVAAAVVAGIRRELWDYEHERVLRRGTDSAWDLSQRGFATMTRFRPEALREARGWFERALRLDPRLGNAGYGIVMTYAIELWNGWASDPDAAARAALEQAERSVAQDERNALARIGLGVARSLVGELDKAISNLELALELDPGHSFATVQLATFLALADRPGEARSLLDRAERMGIEKPLLWSFEYAKAVTAFADSDWTGAVHHARKCLEIRPHFHVSRVLLAAALGHLGELDEGRRVLPERSTGRGGMGMAPSAKHIALVRSGLKELETSS